MYSVSDAFVDAIKNCERTMRCSLIIGINEIEYLKKIEISQSMANSDFEIGNVAAAKMIAEIADFDNEYSGISFKNQNAELIFTIDLEDGTKEQMPLGIFKLDTVDTEDNIISISGYDAIAQTETPYNPADIYPNTVRSIAMDIAAVCGLELSEDAFTNDGLIIESMPEWGDITCRTALGYIAELAGGCWIADRRGRLKLINYKTPTHGYGSSGYEIEPSDYYSLKVAENNFEGINTLYIVNGEKELAWSVNGEYEYTIADNPLLTDKDTASEALIGLKSAMANTDYRPYELEYSCNPALDLGDGIIITDMQGNNYYSVICSKSLSYDGGLRGTLAAYADESIASKGSSGQNLGEQVKTAQKTAEGAKTTAETAQKVAEEVKATLDNLPEIGATIVNENVIKSDTMQAVWCFARYMLVQFMETNFDALDTTKAYNQLRKYIRIFDDNIKVIEAELSNTETEDYTDPNGQKLYWTAVTGTNAHKFFTYTSPLTIAASERPEGLTDSEFEALYTVKVRKTVAEYVKCSLGFPISANGTGEPELVFGTGDGSGNGKYYFVKDADSGRFVYTSRTDGKEYGIAIKDDAPYLVTAGQITQMYPIAVRADISDVSDLPAGTIIFQGNIM